MKAFSFAFLFLLAAAVATAAAGQDCFERCVESKRCDSWHEQSPTRRRCEERCLKLCPPREEGTTDANGADDSNANEAKLLQANGTCCNVTNITWPTNATFGDIATANLTATNVITTDRMEVAGGIQAKSTVVSRIYTEELAASGFVTSDGILVKNQARFRGQINAKAVIADQLDTTTASIETLGTGTVHVSGTLTAGKIEINGEITNLAKEFALLQQRVKDLEDMLLSSKEVKECLQQKDG